MDNTQKLAEILALHEPLAWREAMVYSVWQDGEITLEKGGDLFGQRNMHCIAWGDPAKAMPIEGWPNQQSNGNARIFVNSHENALVAQKIIFGG